MILPLLSKVQHYAWGGFQFIPDLLQLQVPQAEPFAELWMGAHPGAPSSVIVEQHPKMLTAAIAENPAWWLGKESLEKFGPQLPFLFKILDVRCMLSIQAHPNKARAEAGFNRENELGIPMQAAQRVFKDANHKPEVMIALSEFWLLHGFRPLNEISSILEETPAFRPLLAHFHGNNLPALYRHIMEMPQHEVDKLLKPLRKKLLPLLESGQLGKTSADFWAARAFLDFELPGGHCDRGVFSIYLLNLVQLKPGQGIFQGAGIPHAYLEGQNVELMANSDNVFRGGLTPKYIAVQALIDNLVFDPVIPQILEGEAREYHETIYVTPAPDFELSAIHLQAGARYEHIAAAGPEIIFVMQGSVQANSDKIYKRGESMFVTPQSQYYLHAVSESILYKASVGRLND
jgi:mannose-6-phosphate isomerase